MADWRQDLFGVFGELAWQARRTAGAIGRVIRTDPWHVVGYRGYGTSDRALVLARVLQDEGMVDPDRDHSRLRNLVEMLKRVEADPYPFARVRARVPGLDAARELVADDEGFVRAWIAAPGAFASAGWHPVGLELSGTGHGPRPTSSAQILVPPATASFGVVSDMDDTVLQSEVTNVIRAARIVLLENALTRLPFPGVAAFYRALARGATGAEENPVFYVSSSPWNIYDMIARFLDAQGIPIGPLLLRDWDVKRMAQRHQAHKGAAIREILDTYPALPFILVGDSGQEDPEIYAEVVREIPGRIRAVYIRNVTPHAERTSRIRALAREVADAGSTLVLADDTLTVARHAAAHGWISADALPEIGGEKRADEGATSEKAPAPGAPEVAEKAPTVVVDSQVSSEDVS
jgi:phosphatidate phosphatase APP1